MVINFKLKKIILALLVLTINHTQASWLSDKWNQVVGFAKKISPSFLSSPKKAIIAVVATGLVVSGIWLTNTAKQQAPNQVVLTAEEQELLELEPSIRSQCKKIHQFESDYTYLVYDRSGMPETKCIWPQDLVNNLSLDDRNRSTKAIFYPNGYRNRGFLLKRLNNGKLVLHKFSELGKKIIDCAEEYKSCEAYFYDNKLVVYCKKLDGVTRVRIMEYSPFL